jgi:MFS family permease
MRRIKMNNKLFRYKLNVYLMYGYWFFHNLIFAYVIERLYWASRGMTNQQVVYTEIVYAVVVIILEVPTGSLADRWSKKIMLLMSAILSVAEFVMLIYAHNFWHFALAVSFAGIGRALSSGTSNALVYESLKRINKQDSFEKVIGRVNFFDYFAAMLAAIIGSYIAYNNGNLTTYYLSLFGVGIAVVLTLFILDPEASANDERHESYSTCMKEAYTFLKSSIDIRFVLLFGIVIVAVITYLDEFWQIYLNSIKIPVYLFGFVSVARSLASSISGLYAYKVKERFSYNQVFAVLLCIIAVALTATSYMNTYVGLIPLIVAFLAYGLVEPLTMGYLHHRTESNMRATVESFQSLVLRGFTIIVGLVFGYYSTHFSIFIGFRVLAIMLVIYGIYFVFSKNRRFLVK